MAVSSFEIVREFVFWIEGLDHVVKGRVMRKIAPAQKKFPVSWQISHYYKPSKGAASIHIPSKTIASSSKDAEKLLRLYADTFTTIDVEPNQHY